MHSYIHAFIHSYIHFLRLQGSSLFHHESDYNLQANICVVFCIEGLHIFLYQRVKNVMKFISKLLFNLKLLTKNTRKRITPCRALFYFIYFSIRLLHEHKEDHS